MLNVCPTEKTLWKEKLGIYEELFYHVVTTFRNRVVVYES